MKLNLKQTKAIDFLEDHKTNELLFGGGAGGGKSILGCYWQIKNRFKYPRTRGLIGRAKLKTLKETTYVSFLKVCQMQGLRAGVHFNVNSQSNIITFQNKSEILMKDLFYYPSDPNFDELGSLEITDAFIDECNQLNGKAWNIVRSRLRHDIELNGLIPKMLGTCNPSKGFIYDRFYKPSRDGILGNDKQFIKSLVTDNKDYIDKYYIENLNQLDEISKQRLLHGNWEYDDDPAILMQYDNIVDLFCNEHVLTGKKFITCDVARMGKDKTIIRVWEGMRSIKKVIIDKSKLTEVAQVIKKLQSDYSVPNSNTICDEDGVGGGVVDILNCKGFVGNSKPLLQNNKQPNYTNLRSQCYFTLADIVNNNEMYLNDLNIAEREQITKELEVIKQSNVDADTKLSVISKDAIKSVIGHSPDESDCIMMRMWFYLQPNTTPQTTKLFKL